MLAFKMSKEDPKMRMQLCKVQSRNEIHELIGLKNSNIWPFKQIIKDVSKKINN
jgi:hypothetical protein